MRWYFNENIRLWGLVWSIGRVAFWIWKGIARWDRGCLTEEAGDDDIP